MKQSCGMELCLSIRFLLKFVHFSFHRKKQYHVPQKLAIDSDSMVVLAQFRIEILTDVCGILASNVYRCCGCGNFGCREIGLDSQVQSSS